VGRRSSASGKSGEIYEKKKMGGGRGGRGGSPLYISSKERKMGCLTTQGGFRRGRGKRRKRRGRCQRRCSISPSGQSTGKEKKEKRPEGERRGLKRTSFLPEEEKKKSLQDRLFLSAEGRRGDLGEEAGRFLTIGPRKRSPVDISALD